LPKESVADEIKMAFFMQNMECLSGESSYNLIWTLGSDYMQLSLAF